MNEISKIFLIVRGQICEAFLSLRIWAGYLVGYIMLMGGREYLDYAGHDSIQICEPFLVMQGNVKAFYALYFGLFIIISDAPYLNARTQSVVMRVTRTTWRRAMMIYTAVQSAVYMSVVALLSMLISIPYAYTGNIWSVTFQQAVKMTAVSGKAYVFLTAPSRQLLTFGSPWKCFFVSLVLLSAYGYILSLIVFLFNFRFLKNVGTGIAFIIHLFSFAAVRGYILIPVRWIPGALGSLDVIVGIASSGVSVLYALIFFALIFLVLESVIKVIVKHSDFVFSN